MPKDLQKNVAHILKDLHARESMRLGWYRQWSATGDHIRVLREKKASHQAFLHQLLRSRDLTPAWYARLFYYLGHISGFVTAFLPDSWVARIEKNLEFWILERYQKYFRRLELDRNIRSMIEAMQLNKMAHNEPGHDIIILIENIIREQKQVLGHA
jgi:demethoxyubiquinone hydroxylase (CLK1/Coq7/Cat5 family)